MRKQIEKIPQREERKAGRLKGIFRRFLGGISKRLLNIFIIVIVIFVVFILIFSFFGDKTKTEKKEISWQAVFLTNGQVYFGKISEENEKEIILRNIYYLRTTENFQQGEEPTEFSLIKLGEELHGPTDEMRINRNHVLFLESLRNDSRVVQAIRKHLSQSTE